MRNVFTTTPTRTLAPDIALAHDLAQTTNLQAALETVVRAMTGAVQFNGALLLLLDAEHQRLVVAAHWGFDTLDPIITLDMNATAIGKALHERRRLRYSHVQMRGVLPMLVGDAPRTMLCFPLYAATQPLAMLCLTDSCHDNAFPADQQEFVQAVVELLTPWVQTAIYRTQMQREGERIATLERLATAFELPLNASEEALQHETLRRLTKPYLAPSSFAQLAENPELFDRLQRITTCNAVVLLIGIKGIERVKAQLSLQHITERIYHPFFDILGHIIYQHGGFLDQQHNASLVALFGYPALSDADVVHAATVAQHLLVASRRLNQQWRNTIGSNLAIAVALTIGQVVVGPISAGAQRRYIVHGEAIEHARKTHALARNGEIVASEELIERLPPHVPFTIEPLQPFIPVDDIRIRHYYRLIA